MQKRNSLLCTKKTLSISFINFFNACYNTCVKKIEVNNLCFSYNDDSTTLSDVSFAVEKGKYVSIVGHNGSGKSTLAKLLIGLLEKKSGEIYIDGVELTPKTYKDIRKKVALVFQNPDNQFIGSTVEDDIAFGLENRCVDRKDMQSIIDEFAEKVGMKEFLQKEPSALSGGQKQRVAIAGALALSPEIIIFDEATSMLDPRGKREISEIIVKMREENPELTILSITHNVEEAYASDEIIVISSGKLVLQGTPNEVFSKKQIIETLQLDVPFRLELEEKLKELNIDISSCKNDDEIVEVLCQSK